MVLVDTTIWSLALRRRRDALSSSEVNLIREWSRLIEAGEALLIGPIRQEVLSGVRHALQFKRLQQLLGTFQLLSLRIGDYDRAAEFYNAARSRGIAGSAVDFLICAAAYRGRTPVFTTDADFSRYARVLPIKLHAPL
jgi:hypothetical protein